MVENYYSMGFMNFINEWKQNNKCMQYEQEISKQSAQLERDLDSGKITESEFYQKADELDELLDNKNMQKQNLSDKYWNEEF